MIEIPCWTFRKRALRDGVWREVFRAPFPAPFNYGFAEGSLAPDGDPLDVIVIGPRLLCGSRVRVRPVLRAVFMDEGQRDDKLIGRLDGGPLQPLDRLLIRTFFWIYTRFKRARLWWQGKPTAGTGLVGYQDP